MNGKIKNRANGDSVSFLSGRYSFLSRRNQARREVFMRNGTTHIKAQSKKIQGVLLASTGLFFAFCQISFAFTQVTISTGAPQGTEASFLSATSNQFQVAIQANPLAANTYSMKIYGPNPNYQAPPAPPSTLEEALSLGSTVYVYGFVDGQTYNQGVSHNIVESFEVDCSTPMPNVPNWDETTCEAVTGAIDDAIFQESLSTPTVIPPGGK